MRTMDVNGNTHELRPLEDSSSDNSTESDNTDVTMETSDTAFDLTGDSIHIGGLQFQKIDLVIVLMFLNLVISWETR